MNTRAPAIACAITILLSAGPLCAETIENTQLKATVTAGGLRLESKIRDGAAIPTAPFAHPVEKLAAKDIADEKRGTGSLIRVTYKNGWTTRIALYDRSPFLHLSATATGPLETDAVDILDYTVTLGDTPLRSFGTGGLEDPGKKEGSYAFHAAVEPATRNGFVSGWLTHDRAVGVFMVDAADGGIRLKARLEFGHYRVEQGTTRETETLLLGYFDDARRGLEAYADAVAAHYDIQLKPKPCVYCTWYHAGASDEKAIAENTAFAEQHLKPWGLSVMQIDDRWQAILPDGFEHEGKIKKTGPVKVFVDTNDNYPGGMAKTADTIAARGMVPGIWFMPFAGNFRNPYFDHDVFFTNPDGTPFHDGRWSGTCVDATGAAGAAFIRKRVRRVYDWGYRYLKIDGMHTGLGTYNIYVNTHYQNKDFGKPKLHDPGKTHVQAYRQCLRIVQEEAPEAFVLGCNVSQNMRCMGPAFGMIGAMRIGPDNGGAARGRWGSVTKGAWHGTNLYFLNGRVWHNDPDPVYVRKSNPLPAARWMCSWLAVSGAMHTSSEQYPALPPDRLDLLRRCLPTHECTARPVDLFDTDTPRVWITGDDRLHVVGLFNWDRKKPAEITCGIEKLGLDASKTYAAFEYWTDRFLAPFSGKLKQTLPGGACRVLAVRERAGRPVLVSTSRNITQGLTDVIAERWDAGTKTLAGRSRVVPGDPYELRIDLPGEGWEVKKAVIGGNTLTRKKEGGTGLRLTFTPEKTGEVSWEVGF